MVRMVIQLDPATGQIQVTEMPAEKPGMCLAMLHGAGEILRAKLYQADLAGRIEVARHLPPHLTGNGAR